MKADKHTWPEYMYRALGHIYYGGGFDHRQVERFARRNGGVDLETLERVLQEGAGEDKLIAIYALGYAYPPHVQQLLRPMLLSSLPLEREASAIALGRLQDEQALPVLHSLLQETLSNPDRPLDDEYYRLMSALMTIASILGDWGQNSSVPFLRSALKATWQWEQERTANPLIHDELIVSPWQAYEHELAYALGQLGAFGALTGIKLSDPRERISMAFLALGHLQAEQQNDDLFMLMSDKAIQEKVAGVLADRFGLSEAEQRDCVNRFGRDYLWEGALESKKTLYFGSIEKD